MPLQELCLLKGSMHDCLVNMQMSRFKKIANNQKVSSGSGLDTDFLSNEETESWERNYFSCLLTGISESVSSFQNKFLPKTESSIIIRISTKEAANRNYSCLQMLAPNQSATLYNLNEWCPLATLSSGSVFTSSNRLTHPAWEIRMCRAPELRFKRLLLVRLWSFSGRFFATNSSDKHKDRCSVYLRQSFYLPLKCFNSEFRFKWRKR